ncbi:Pyridoxamine 5'-phosphate oxidase [Streptomyces sp. 2224.1]|uniref:pyridoxamine 5'-phosphate oxidase family protein n=1 Tax=unclassified Streptomyces TaxID=2593676 RepID=UPI000885CC23|nr:MULTISPECIES: pyridoxamine 5'-phosphate oxidase family protein [unclassified Streptomyces]PBC82999.1 pyridoxamine 5'-phosphate oxidase [Streptomyces sp. 2321.6]SDR45750.1 Pyridoxamine 5'-phosphate oxidase [Streptomyces sp. KS_16]SEC24816.1 Pyridoxamine 5'-phosphate oxidase [Streptomyces sp. 2224.1]SEC80101.1 Pyridoxamine 5'-phosphate oxidase [Streptomyces sp. 2133.1]SEE88453.1 Pyridoxamine 5'-phosphate oxidase [Streptomyces sp. 2112.3]
MTSEYTCGGAVGDGGGAVGWSVVEAAVPEFAGRVRERFGAYRHHVLATLRKDGGPRLTGLEADFRYGELWLGMMVGSRKVLDLRRDPRFSLHANPGPGTDLSGGDVRVSGRAVEVTDPEAVARYAAVVKPPEPFHLFRAELTEVLHTSVEDPYVVLESWVPGRPLRTIRRRSDDATPRMA